MSTKTGLAPGAGDGPGGGEERVGRGDHFVARPDVLGHQAHQQGVAAGGDGDGVRAAAVRRQLGLALGDTGPRMHCWLSRTASTAARISSRIVAYWAFRSSSGTFIGCDISMMGVNRRNTSRQST